MLVHLVWTAAIDLNDGQLASFAFARRVTLVFLETVKFDLAVTENFGFIRVRAHSLIFGPLDHFLGKKRACWDAFHGTWILLSWPVCLVDTTTSTSLNLN